MLLYCSTGCLKGRRNVVEDEYISFTLGEGYKWERSHPEPEYAPSSILISSRENESNYEGKCIVVDYPGSQDLVEKHRRSCFKKDIKTINGVKVEIFYYRYSWGDISRYQHYLDPEMYVVIMDTQKGGIGAEADMIIRSLQVRKAVKKGE